MRKKSFEPNDIINNLRIIKEDRVVVRPNGTKVVYWICECLKCGSITSKSTQNIKHCKSCGCEQYRKDSKAKGSGRKTKEGTNFYINCLISIYKGNAKNRNIDFALEYDDFKKLVTGECFYCGDKETNKLIKKNYPPYYYNGIDRIDNSIGYTKDNCVSCCEFCNKAKRNVPIEKFYEKCIKIAEIAKNRIENNK